MYGCHMYLCFSLVLSSRHGIWEALSSAFGFTFIQIVLGFGFSVDLCISNAKNSNFFVFDLVKWFAKATKSIGVVILNWILDILWNIWFQQLVFRSKHKPRFCVSLRLYNFQKSGNKIYGLCSQLAINQGIQASHQSTHSPQSSLVCSTELKSQWRLNTAASATKRRTERSSLAS